MTRPAPPGRSLPPGPAALPRRVVDLCPEDPRWADLAAGSPDALPFHHPSWFQVIQYAFGYQPAALGCADDAGRLLGVLPLFEKHGLLSGRHLSSLPNTPVAGPVAADAGSIRSLLSAAIDRVDSSAARGLQLKVLGAALDGQTGGFSRVAWAPAYVLDLAADPGELPFGGPKDKSSIMRAIRKARRTGVVVREASSLNDVRHWYRLYLETMRTHTAPPRPFRMFELMWELLAPQRRMRLLLAERTAGGRTQLLAGSVFLASGCTVSYLCNGRDAAQLEFRPNDAIHWAAISEACAAGFRRYDLGEVAAGNDGLARFKEKWGAQPVELFRYHYPPHHREVERGVLGPGNFRGALEWTWRKLPRPVTAGLGGWICRRL